MDRVSRSNEYGIVSSQTVFDSPSYRTQEYRVDLSSNLGEYRSGQIAYDLNVSMRVRKVLYLISGGIFVPNRILINPTPVLHIQFSSIFRKYQNAKCNYQFAMEANPARSYNDFTYFEPVFPELELGETTLQTLSIGIPGVDIRDNYLYVTYDGQFSAPNHGLITGDILSSNGVHKPVTVVDDYHFTVDFPATTREFIVESFVFHYHVMIKTEYQRF